MPNSSYYSKKKAPTPFVYNIHSTLLTLTDSAKYLGVTIDSKLTFSTHINNVNSKANSTLAFLRRNLHSCPGPVKETCYKTFVRPILEYASSSWAPYQQNHIDQLESVQKRAARFVTGNHDLTTGNTAKNMATLGWDSLEERRARGKLTTLHKARTGAITIPLDDLLVLNPDSGTRHSTHYFVPYSSLNCHLHSFYPSTIRLWNALPPDLKTPMSLDSFKNSLNKITTTPPPSTLPFDNGTVFNCHTPFKSNT